MALMANQLSQAKAGATGDTADGKTNPAEGLSLKKAPVRAGIEANAVIDEKNTQKTDKADPAALTGKEASSKAAANFAATMTPVEMQAAESKQASAAKLHDTLAAIPNGAAPQLQQVAPALTQAAGQITDKLTPAVGSPAWDQALGQKVVWMVAGEQHSASLTLNPPDLGPMQVVLHVSNGHADAAFTSNQPEVRQALEAAMPKLREMMSDAGIQLGQATIGMSMPQQQNGSGDQSSPGSRGGFSQNNDSIDTATRVTGTTKIVSGQGLVDTFA
jgi:flagellar hook-length control protein FliK